MSNFFQTQSEEALCDCWLFSMKHLGRLAYYRKPAYIGEIDPRGSYGTFGSYLYRVSLDTVFVMAPRIEPKL